LDGQGLRMPARHALLADVVPAGVYGWAYGFERAMGNLGAIGGPLPISTTPNSSTKEAGELAAWPLTPLPRSSRG
jgi:hypothetical protein